MNSENIRGFNDQILIKNDDIDIFHDLSSLEGLRWPDSVISDSFLEGCLPSTSSDQICDSDEAGSYKESEIYLPGNENKDETLVEDDQYYIMVTGLSKEEIFDTLNKCLQLKYQATTTAVVESMDAYPSRADSNIKGGTFRGLTDRLTDPQALKPSELPKPSLGSTAESSEAFALSRPRPSELMYQRQASFRGLGQLSGNTPFKRAGKGHTSLRLNDLPSNRDRVGVSLSDSPILEDMELPPSNLEPDTASVVTKSSQSSKTVYGLSVVSDEYLTSLAITFLKTRFGKSKKRKNFTQRSGLPVGTLWRSYCLEMKSMHFKNIISKKRFETCARTLFSAPQKRGQAVFKKNWDFFPDLHVKKKKKVVKLAVTEIQERRALKEKCELELENSEGLIVVNGYRKYICTDCSHVAPSPAKLKCHKRLVHSGIKPFWCHECDSHFKSWSSFKNHIRFSCNPSFH